MVQVVRFTVAGATAESFDPQGRAFTVIYDGHCKVCTRLSAVLRKWEGNNELNVVSSQMPGVQASFPWIPPGAYQESLQLIGPGGATWQGAAAIEQLLTILPRGGLFGWLFKLPFARTLADRFYRWFAKNRYRFGCGEHCQVRPQDLKFD